MNCDKELTAEDILACDDFGDIQRVDVPEWGGHVFVKKMSCKERDRFEINYMRLKEGKEIKPEVRVSLVVASACNKDKKQMFNYGQLQKLNDKSADAMTRVYAAALELNKMSNDDVEELEKNSLPAQPEC